MTQKIVRFLSVFFVLFLVFSLYGCGQSVLYSNSEEMIPTISLTCSKTFILDLEDETYISFSADHSDVIYPASTTKLLTSLLALEVLPPETEITPGEEVYFSPKNSSSAFIRPHHTLTLEMLIEGMMLPSGNDAAYAVAAACGRKIANNEDLSPRESVDAFVSKMNDYARELGCTNSNFTTPDGFAGEEHYTTTADMAIIAKTATENEIIMKYVGLLSDNVVYASGHTNTWTNTNLQLDPSSKYYNEYIKGMKTGSLPDSYSIISLYDDGTYRFIIGVFGSSNENGRYSDTNSLISEYIKAKTKA